MRRAQVWFLVLVLPGVAYAQHDACIDTAWMSSRSMLGQNDPAFARDLIAALKPEPFIGPRGNPFSPVYDAEDFSLQWPLVLREYAWQTGDVETVAQYVPGKLRILLNYFTELESENGLLSAAEVGESLVHWPESLRENYDYETASASDSGVLNAYYFAALQAGATLMEELGGDFAVLTERAGRVREAFNEHLLDSATGLYRDASDSEHFSVHTNALAACFDLADANSHDAIADFLLLAGLDTHPYLRPYVIEALFKTGHAEQALAMIEEYRQTGHAIDTHFLVREYALGLRPERPGWSKVSVRPGIGARYPHPIADAIDAGGERITARYIPGLGLQVTVAPGIPVLSSNNTGLSIMIKNAVSHARDPLDDEQRAQLESAGWADRAAGQPAIWIDADTQMLRLIDGGDVLYQARCATAEKGLGSKMHSLQTPLGWHSVAGKIGENSPLGQVFRSRRPTREVWKPGDEVVEDLVLTRVILLQGEEPGKNKGGDVDSFARNIYIHGTNDEARIGTPSSHGCVRMLNDDIVELFPMIPKGAPVLITSAMNGPAADSD